MAKFLFALIPLGILISGLSLRPEPQPEETLEPELSQAAPQLSVLRMQAPMTMDFCGTSVPLGNLEIWERLNRELQYQLKYPHGAKLVLKRFHRYEETFRSILEEQGIPQDFIYLAVAESQLSNATSPVGAQGFWQFMKPTAKAYGLEVSSTVDERFDPVKSTYAACRYLKESYERFGDWPLVAASYNMGMGGINRAMKRQQQFNYFHLELNPETHRYLFRILAYKLIIEHPKSYGLFVDQDDLYDPIPCKRILVRQNIGNLATFAESEGTDLETLRMMNPWLVSHNLVISRGKSFDIQIPMEDAPSANELLVQYPDQPDASDVDS
ncbi:lytic transglycosylase domain-containing protein [Pontibacter sp. G13]|uniref:lytic transglycosylase domain-containing protein n=1 Tax=Pontibacter sp. G13 TaxID=3074898 RepID=UPI00288C010E|nr:lytic transglycosylase domain-containing protein [Pontibacter sp. G13]WNJ19558.1 lytic transglycosylase domain-containing protein [Pontibacter sp. G13]